MHLVTTVSHTAAAIENRCRRPCGGDTVVQYNNTRTSVRIENKRTTGTKKRKNKVPRKQIFVDKCSILWYNTNRGKSKRQPPPPTEKTPDKRLGRSVSRWPFPLGPPQGTTREETTCVGGCRDCRAYWASATAERTYLYLII